MGKGGKGKVKMPVLVGSKPYLFNKENVTLWGLLKT